MVVLRISVIACSAMRRCRGSRRRTRQRAGRSEAFLIAPSFAPAADHDPLARLERLNALRAAGALSDSEFERLKALLLAAQ
jgi:hypothetical protein